METRPMTAWLIMCEPIGDHVECDKEYLDIVSARRGVPYIRKYLQRLHDFHFHDLSERTSFERYRDASQRPYLVEQAWTQTGLVLTVGHNPIFKARKVRNLVVNIDDDTGQETVTWDCYP